MGYTHYFRQQRNFSNDEWNMIKKAFEKLKNNLAIVDFEKIYSADYCQMFSLTGENGEDVIIVPEVSCDWTSFYNHRSLKGDQEAICFNGDGKMAHETFIIEKKPDELGFNFCKTNGKPYDLMVTSMLIVVAGYTDAMLISSDGELEDWEQSVKYVSHVLKKPTKIFFNEHGYLEVRSPTPEEIEAHNQEEIFKETFSKKKNKKIHVHLESVK